MFKVPSLFLVFFKTLVLGGMYIHFQMLWIITESQRAFPLTQQMQSVVYTRV